MFDYKSFTKKGSKVVYKLLHDLLLMLIIFFVLAMIAEGLLPGIVSSHIGLYKIVLVILGTLLFMNITSKKAGIIASSLSAKKSKSALIFALAILIFNGMRGIGLPVGIFVLLLTLTSLYFFYHLFFLSDASS